MNLCIIGGSSHPTWNAQVSQTLGVPLTPVTSKVFSNGNRFVRIEESVRGDDVFVIQTQVPSVDEHIMELLILIRTLRDASAGRITAVLPYFPYSRSDKKDQSRVCIAARLIADLLQTAGANRVMTMELHAPQIQGFFSVPCDHLVAAPILIAHLKKRAGLENTVLVAGDAGAAKMVKYFEDGLNLPIAIMDKRRTGNNEEVSIRGVVGDVTGKTALLIDDETSTGKTLIRDAEYLLQSAGARAVDACVAHAAFDEAGATRLAQSCIDTITTTDTIPSPSATLGLRHRVVSVADMFAACIRSVHEHKSIGLLNAVETTHGPDR